MDPRTVICIVGLTACSLFVLSQATVGGQYSVNVHFVPPLVTAPCQIAQFWSPPNVTCGMCFCMTGTLSRCIPQPGCNPNSPNNATTTTPPPGGDNNNGNNNGGGNPASGQEGTTMPPAAPPPMGGSTMAPAAAGAGGTTMASASSAAAGGGGMTTMGMGMGGAMGASTDSSMAMNMVKTNRGSKPGKSRRRRHARNL